jgi:hypothetical protein
MAVVLTHTFKCDRCGVVIAAGPEDETLASPAMKDSRSCKVDFFVNATGRELHWRLLCEDCREIASMFFEALRYQNARQSEQNDGRKFFERLMSYKSAESVSQYHYAGSLMYRAMRLLGRKVSDEE